MSADTIELTSAINNAVNNSAPREEGFAFLCAVGGAAVAATLELISPTGSKTSAVVAAAVGGSVALVAEDYLDALPQNNLTGGLSFAVTAVISMKAGRIAADYFPGNAS